MTVTDVPVARSESSFTECLDIDSHEMVPVHMWVEVFGDGAKRLQSLAGNMALLGANGPNALKRNDIEGDLTEISHESAWQVRGAHAPSAIDMARRPALLDVMGVRRQLVFPSFATIGLVCLLHPLAHEFFGYDPNEVDNYELGHEIVEAHNKWAVQIGHEFGTDRMRPVGLIMTDSLEQMMADAEAQLAEGIRAVNIPVGLPPAGLSPADRALDPFWRLFEEANVPITIHIGTEFPFLQSPMWGANVPEFESSLDSLAEFPVQPFWGATVHQAPETFLTAMVLGGVFERHPRLRFGMIEVGAQWLGPLAERLDMWGQEFHKRLSSTLSMRPSEYINRNVRVGPFPFEDVALYFDRYPSVADCYCYTSDFPHIEGGRNSKETFLRNLDDTDDSYVRKFFLENGSLLLPE